MSRLGLDVNGGPIRVVVEIWRSFFLSFCGTSALVRALGMKFFMAAL